MDWVMFWVMFFRIPKRNFTPKRVIFEMPP